MRDTEIAIHLWSGYCTNREDDSINTVDYIAGFVPFVVAASQTLDAQLLAGRDDWSKVFAYDVVHEAGAWLKIHEQCTEAEFQAKLARLIA
jgi:hypothetical protein